MNVRKFAAALILAAPASPAAAQGVPDDVRCFLISSFFAKSASDPKGREVATQSLLFFAGRVDARSTLQTTTESMRGLASTIDGQSAAAEMGACAGRMNQALQTLQDASKAATAKK